MKSVEELDRLFEDAVKRVRRERNYYQHRKYYWRFSTLLAKAIAFSGLFVGVVAPLVPEFANGFLLIPWGSGAQLGYVALALAGLILAVDRVFELSDSWLRYSNAQMHLDTLLAGAKYKWLKFKSSIVDGNIANERLAEAIAICEKLVLEARAIVENEVQGWTENQGNGDGRRDKSKRGSEEQGDAHKNGVMIKLINHKALTGAVSVRIGDVSEIRTQPTQSIVFDNILAGQHKLIISSTMAKDEGKEFRWEDIIFVRDGEPNVYELNLADSQN